MRRPTWRAPFRRIARGIVFGVLVALVFGGGGVEGARQAAPIFGAPFAGAPSQNTWFVSQWYGNTVWAYQNGVAVYGAGQGIHFGIDFAARCGTPVLAIGAGTVFAVDGPYGSAPHNIVIAHANGLYSLYGHLLERPTLVPGQVVRAGQPIALSGDPAGARCDIEPHMHLELRRAGMGDAINPIPLLDVDWARASIGLRRNGLAFERNLDLPERWTLVEDQPEIVFGRALINRYQRAWP